MADNITTHSLKDITDEGISIVRFMGTVGEASYKKTAHRRDDHYLFIFQTKGKSKIIVDFNEVELTAAVVLCILPGQVHYGVSADHETDAWLITLDVNLVNNDARVIFDDYYFQYEPLPLPGQEGVSLNSCIELILSLKANGQQLNFMPQVEHSLITACVGMFASAYQQIKYKQGVVSRTDVLTQQFKRLLLQQFKTHKSTADYARLLNITPAHLNEAVKLTTGFTVTHWIQQTVLTEAKRLLYATDATVKEIAYLLGFADPAYFTRYFSNAAGSTPLQFRFACRK